ncbi:ABC transporter permease [Tissierella sp. MB52-C2]|uniref:ABC transporter permease n=1 Tax=Tissierella sp. MB52-C2 TaxID=3070999 RepID=UPI00280A4DCD|nr:ABC transporter permease [Tissierella sp. MB52-C2]WMM26879.1 ABC transporter permease [Tissierella sp. MB52-C2]
MIKNEFIKFFRPNVILLYITIIILLIGMFGLMFKPDANKYSNSKDIEYFNNTISSEFIYYFLPFFMIFLTSNVFSKDMYTGQLKFFLIGENKRTKILLTKSFVLIIVLSLFIFAINLISSITVGIVIGEFSQVLNIHKIGVIKDIINIIFSILPLLMVFIFISIITPNSIITSISVFFLFLVFDHIIPLTNKYIPTGIIRTYLYNGELLVFNIIIFTLLLSIINFLIFYRKDMME